MALARQVDNPRVIALYSYGYQAGKDTTGGIVQEWAKADQRPCLRTAFAWTMKIVCAESLGIGGTDQEKVDAIDRIKLEQDKSVFTHLSCDGGAVGIVDVISITGRDFIINLSESLKARVDPYIWIRLVSERAKDLGPRGFAVVTDLRFRDEAIAVHEDGGVVVEVLRDAAAKNAGGKRSEEGIPDDLIDYKLDNNASLERLRENTRVMLNRLFPVQRD
jgi:hypothetical protein